MNTETIGTDKLSSVFVRLLKGPVFSDEHPSAWHVVLSSRNAVADFFSKVELDLVVDEPDGFAFLRQRESEEGDEVPRLVARRALSFHTSVLLTLLRKKLLEFDTYQAGARPVVERDELHRAMSVYYGETTNEVKRRSEIDRHIGKAEQMGLLRPMKDDLDKLEIRRIIKAIVTASWLADLDQKLEEYREHGQSAV